MAGPEQQPPERRPGRQDENETSRWYRLAGLGMEFVVAVLLFGGIGLWLDRLLGTVPWLMLAGGALGFGVGLWLMIKAASESFRD